MSLSSEACGVIATLIPVYMLVLYVGRDRLVEFGAPSPAEIHRSLPRKAARRVTYWRRWSRISSTYSIVALTVAEALTILGLVGDSGLDGPLGMLVIASVVGHVVLFGFAAGGALWVDAR